MKIINYLIIVLISLFVVGCSKITESDNNGLGSRAISYQSDDQSESLVIPPSLTNPSLQGDFFNPIETDKYIYKKYWLELLIKQIEKTKKDYENIIIGGDFNIIPDEIDVYNLVIF